jgi:hypothetical protein
MDRYIEARQMNERHARDLISRGEKMIEDIKKTPVRNRTNETYLYISPAHKAKLKAYADSTKRTMRAEAELWIDSLPTS